MKKLGFITLVVLYLFVNSISYAESLVPETPLGTREYSLFNIDAWENGEVKISENCRKLLEAKFFLQCKYGISPEMYTFFESDYYISEDATLTFSLMGRGGLRSVLGVYTVRINAHGITAEWSHDGKTASNDFTSAVWGSKQLNMMLEAAVYTRDLNSYIDMARKLTCTREDRDDIAVTTDSEPSNIRKAEIPVLILHSEAEMQMIAISTVQMILGSQSNCENLVMAADEEPITNYYRRGNVYLFRVTLYLEQDTYENWIMNDGEYTVWINVMDGMVEDIEYNSMLSGAG